ncbi:MAG: response regulator, partial [Caulobacteraceae bacterium]
VGKGSGLGLSQVYGFLQQSGGRVDVESAPGQGAAFRLFLPASAAPTAASHSRGKARRAKGGSERILVVEDDAPVLDAQIGMLRALGYDVVAAPAGPQAMAILASAEERIDLLFSDVAMPGGMNGVDLAREARRLRPGVRILLTSGYLGVQAEFPRGEFPLIDKPYQRDALASKLREVLESKDRRAMAPA